MQGDQIPPGSSIGNPSKEVEEVKKQLQEKETIIAALVVSVLALSL